MQILEHCSMFMNISKPISEIFFPNLIMQDLELWKSSRNWRNNAKLASFHENEIRLGDAHIL